MKSPISTYSIFAGVGWGGVGVGGRWGGRLLTFSAFRMGAYSRWAALIRGWALIRINTVIQDQVFFLSFQVPSFLP